MTKKELPKLIPFVIALTLVLTHIIQVLLMPGYTNEEGQDVTYSVLDSVQYAAFGLGIVLTLILVNKPVWKHAFAILILLSFSPIVDFYNVTFGIEIGSLSIDLISTTILFLHFALNRGTFSELTSTISGRDQSPDSQKEQFEASVQGFQERFRNKSTSDLEEIVNDNSLVPEAVEAARRILSLR